jgi:hypothetical protein
MSYMWPVTVLVSLCRKFRPVALNKLLDECSCYNPLFLLFALHHVTPQHEAELEVILSDFDRATLLICGNKMPTKCNR